MEKAMIDHVAVQSLDKHNVIRALYVEPNAGLKEIAQSLEWKLLCDLKK